MLLGLKEDHYGMKDGVDPGKCESRQRGSGGSSGSSSSSGGGVICDGGKRTKNGGGNVIGGSSPGVPAPAPGGGFGFMRRPVPSGNGGNSAKYAVPVTTVPGPGGKVGGMGREQLLTPEEYSKAHSALVAATSHSSHISPYSVITTIQQQQQQQQHPPSCQSPKIRTKVKVSGGTQTTNDLHEMGTNGRGGSAHAALYAQHHHMLQHHPHHSQTLPGHASGSSMANQSEGDYASSVYSRNSGSFASSSQQQGTSSSGYKSLSLTTPTAAQLSQSLRERILGSQSLPKGATSSADYAAILAAIQQQQQHHHHHHLQHQQIYGTPNSSRDRMSRYAAAAAAAAASGNGGSNGSTGKNGMNDGSLSDAGGYVAYSEIYAAGAGQGSGSNPFSWMRHSTGYASSITSAPTRLIGGKTTKFMYFFRKKYFSW